MLKGDKIYLRVLQKSDATKLLIWENNPINWKVSDTEVPFTMDQVIAYIENSHNVRSTLQVRFVICKNEDDTAIGAIDLYDINFKHGFGSVGILIADKKDEGAGYASEALFLLIEYARDFLDLHNLQATMHHDNLASQQVFEKNGFQLIGERKEWLRYKQERFNEKIFQLCLKN